MSTAQLEQTLNEIEARKSMPPFGPSAVQTRLDYPFYPQVGFPVFSELIV